MARPKEISVILEGPGVEISRESEFFLTEEECNHILLKSPLNEVLAFANSGPVIFDEK